MGVERVTGIERALSAWEVSSTIRGLPAETLICGILARPTIAKRRGMGEPFAPSSVVWSWTRRST